MAFRAASAACLLLAACLPAGAEERPLLCFGNEPFWSLDLTQPGVGRFATPDTSSAEYRGGAVRQEWLGESLWRGKPAAGDAGELVAFLRDGACSDGMSDTVHPVSARVSLPDGVFLAGCCRVPLAAPAAAPALEGPVWLLEELSGQDAARLAAARPALNVRFDAGRVDGFSGCNRFVGTYTLAGAELRLGTLAGTMMACAEPAMSLEHAFRGLLEGTLEHSIAEGRLRLTSEAGASATLREQPAPSLEGVEWEVTGFNNGRQAVVSPLLGTALTLSFRDGAVSGAVGCNNFRASYSSEGSRLEIGPAAVTTRACLGEGVMEQEQQFLAALAAATSWSLRDERLDLYFEDGARALTARAK
jgi:heat shock protein HslJ